MTKTPPSIPAVILPSAVEYNATSLALPASMAFEQWESIGITLLQINKSSRWWIGDWWAFGDRSYGERAAAVTSPEMYKALRTAGWVSRAFREMSRRRDNLEWGYHEAVASLEPSEADELLDRVESDPANWSVKKLRECVRAIKAKPVEEASDDDVADPVDPRDIEIAELRAALEALTDQLEELRIAVAKGVAPEGMDTASVLDELQLEKKRLQMENFGLKKERDSLMAETSSQQGYISKLKRALKKVGVEL